MQWCEKKTIIPERCSGVEMKKVHKKENTNIYKVLSYIPLLLLLNFCGFTYILRHLADTFVKSSLQ